MAGAAVVTFPLSRRRSPGKGLPVINSGAEIGLFAGLLPDERLIASCEAIYRVDLSAVFLSPPPMSGDLWGLLPIDSDKLAVFCADVCGHGPEVAPHARKVHEILHAPDLERTRPQRVLAQVNTGLHGYLPPGRFAAMFYAVIDTARDRMDYACSTFMPPLWRQSGDSAYELLEGAGLPLGFQPRARYENHSRRFERGAGLVMYSDALVETPMPPQAVFDTDSLCHAVNQFGSGADSATINARLIDALDLEVNPLEDDLTLVTLLRR
ncbi:PP2C family protein-serine/threonine phosphatase [Asticcacaulis biprosthecium]|uniref:PP2C family protein-serine/threonine phosphatase n=1 Tax=Asticcacaulis biprosthecium TaxID=76891 RepID=UPI000A00E229|nr:PP2C family protein-serine/threonine phosphatase [Asticcacaulis biprosthecium]